MKKIKWEDVSLDFNYNDKDYFHANEPYIKGLEEKCAELEGQVERDQVYAADVSCSYLELKKKCAEYEEVLGFYSNDNDWGLDWDYVNKQNVEMDHGFVARQVLDKHKDKK